MGVYFRALAGVDRCWQRRQPILNPEAGGGGVDSVRQNKETKSRSRARGKVSRDTLQRDPGPGRGPGLESS
jgi:hypothetical protein